jgi:hypothetical protein
MGGHSKWPILQDKEIARFTPFLKNPPKVVAGLLEEEAKKTFIRMGWTMMFE